MDTRSLRALVMSLKAGGGDPYLLARSVLDRRMRRSEEPRFGHRHLPGEEP